MPYLSIIIAKMKTTSVSKVSMMSMIVPLHLPRLPAAVDTNGRVGAATSGCEKVGLAWVPRIGNFGFP